MIVKHSPNSFVGTDLRERLQELGGVRCSWSA